MKTLVLVGLILSSVAFAETAQVESVEATEAMDYAVRCEAVAIDGVVGVATLFNEFAAANQAVAFCQQNSNYPRSCRLVRCYAL